MTAMYLKRRAKLVTANNIKSLQLAIAAAKERVHDAKRIGWKAYEQSFQADLDLFNARLSTVLLERYAA